MTFWGTLFFFVAHCGIIIARKKTTEVRRAVIVKKKIKDEELLRISDVSEISGVHIRTLQRWINDGELTNFLTVYKSPRGIHYFRLGVPYPDDELVPGETFKYKLPDEDYTG